MQSSVGIIKRLRRNVLEINLQKEQFSDEVEDKAIAKLSEKLGIKIMALGRFGQLAVRPRNSSFSGRQSTLPGPRRQLCINDWPLGSEND